LTALDRAASRANTMTTDATIRPRLMRAITPVGVMTVPGLAGRLDQWASFGERARPSHPGQTLGPSLSVTYVIKILARDCADAK